MHTRGASLIDAALGVDSGARPPPASTSPSAGSASAANKKHAERSGGKHFLGWASMGVVRAEHRDVDSSPSENALIERAFADPSTASVEVPTCFNAVVL